MMIKYKKQIFAIVIACACQLFNSNTSLAELQADTFSQEKHQSERSEATWISNLASIPNSLSNGTAEIVDGKIYVMGGRERWSIF